MKSGEGFLAIRVKDLSERFSSGLHRNLEAEKMEERFLALLEMTDENLPAAHQACVLR